MFDCNPKGPDRPAQRCTVPRLRCWLFNLFVLGLGRRFFLQAPCSRQSTPDLQASASLYTTTLLPGLWVQQLAAVQCWLSNLIKA